MLNVVEKERVCKFESNQMVRTLWNFRTSGKGPVSRIGGGGGKSSNAPGSSFLPTPIPTRRINRIASSRRMNAQTLLAKTATFQIVIT